MNRYIVAIIAALAITALALPVAAQDTPQRTAILYADDEVDGPIAKALASLESSRGHDTFAARWIEATEAGYVADATCVVGVGKDGRLIDGYFSYVEPVKSYAAQGGDRWETAELAGAAVAKCNS